MVVSFGKYIEQTRISRELSQRMLAEKSGLTNSTISRIESDSVRPDIATLEKLAEALNVEKELILSKCGYTKMPEDFILMARKSDVLSVDKQKALFDLLNQTIDQFLEGE